MITIYFFHFYRFSSFYEAMRFSKECNKPLAFYPFLVCNLVFHSKEFKVPDLADYEENNLLLNFDGCIN